VICVALFDLGMEDQRACASFFLPPLLATSVCPYNGVVVFGKIPMEGIRAKFRLHRREFARVWVHMGPLNTDS
jgi:hypothetical protein